MMIMIKKSTAIFVRNPLKIIFGVSVIFFLITILNKQLSNRNIQSTEKIDYYQNHIPSKKKNADYSSKVNSIIEQKVLSRELSLLAEFKRIKSSDPRIAKEIFYEYIDDISKLPISFDIIRLLWSDANNEELDRLKSLLSKKDQKKINNALVGLICVIAEKSKAKANECLESLSHTLNIDQPQCAALLEVLSINDFESLVDFRNKKCFDNSSITSISLAAYAGMLCGKLGYSVTDFLNNPQLCAATNCQAFITSYLNEKGSIQSKEEVFELVSKLTNSTQLKLNDTEKFTLYEDLFSRVESSILADYFGSDNIDENIASIALATLLQKLPCQQGFELALNCRDIESREVLIPQAFGSWLFNDEETSIEYIQNSKLSDGLKDICYYQAFMHFLNIGNEEKARSSAELLRDKNAKDNADLHFKARFQIK